jgi:hypothetical protein
MFGSEGPGLISKRDFDGGIEGDVSGYFMETRPNSDSIDNDGDGLTDDSGDSSGGGTLASVLSGFKLRPDGDFSYDPQRGIDEELPDGFDNDGDGLTDEDLKLASQYAPLLRGNENNPYNFRPVLPGNGLDDDGDSTDRNDTNNSGRIDRGDEGVDPVSERVMADGIDNNGDKRIDEGIDEEDFDGEDDDQDGLVDEDCRAAVMPYQPMPFPAPNDEYSWQISVRRVSAGGDGIDNDGDGAVDEEYYNGLDDPQVGLPAGDGFIDEDVRPYPVPNALLVTVHIFQGGDRKDNDGDGWIDEEANDGVDNDGDAGLRGRGIDEDVYKREFRTTGLVKAPD